MNTNGNASLPPWGELEGGLKHKKHRWWRSVVYDQRVCPVRACLRASSHTPSRPSTVSFRNTDRRRGKNTVPLRSTEKGCTQLTTWHPLRSLLTRLTSAAATK